MRPARGVRTVPAIRIEAGGSGVPYVRCPGCAMDTYSAAGHSTTDACPRCGAALTEGLRWSRLNGLLLVRRAGPEPAKTEGGPDGPPASAAR